jgi:polyhydroxyalkanoate synthesis repressor PhaR
MPTIKRYANRKLYDTSAKRYITLEGIAELIRQGQDVQVVDHASGDDITAQIQAQIIFEEEKKAGGVLPRMLLTDLIQAGNQKLNELRQALSRGHADQDVDAEIERRLARLIERGDVSEADGLRLLDLLVAAGRPEAPVTDADLEHAIRQRNLPSRKDLERITRQVDALQTELEQLLGSASKSGKRR